MQMKLRKIVRSNLFYQKVLPPDKKYHPEVQMDSDIVIEMLPCIINGSGRLKRSTRIVHAG